MTIQTERMRLREWLEEDRDIFAALHGDPEVMRDAGRPLSRSESDAKLNRYMRAFAHYGYSRWAMEDKAGEFLGYVGMLPIPAEHPAGPGVEIGWRLRRAAWGHGFATEGARAALRDGFERLRFPEVVAYTAPDNVRSQAVMRRLGMVRDATRDFIAVDGWTGLVWVIGRHAVADPAT